MLELSMKQLTYNQISLSAPSRVFKLYLKKKRKRFSYENIFIVSSQWRTGESWAPG